MTILLTGATGFIGRHVLTMFLDQGHIVIAFGRRAVKNDSAPDRLIAVEGDIATGEGFDRIPWSEVDAVVHLAASGVKASNRAWAEAVAVNVVGTQRLLTAINQRALRVPMLFISRTFYEHLTQETSALLENPYIATKQAGNQLARLWSKNYAGPVVFGTFFQVYGPGDDGGSVLSYAARELKAGRAAVFGSGKGKRDWIYVTDAAAAVVAIIQSGQYRDAEVDIGTGELVSIKEMIERLKMLTKRTDEAVIFDSSKDRPDVSIEFKAINLPIGWSYRVHMNEGLSRLLKSV